MKILGTLAFLALGLAAASAPASAATICNGCDYLNTDTSQYLGSHNPTNGGGSGDQSTYVHNDIPVGALSDLWVFDVAPAGTMNLTATFNPVAAIANFSVALRAVTANGTCNTTDAQCTALPTLGGVLASNTPGTNNLSLQNIALAAGRYAFVITGMVSDQGGPESYSGNLNVFTAVPEPATLSLLGLGLVVLAARRRRSA